MCALYIYNLLDLIHYRELLVLLKSDLAGDGKAVTMGMLTKLFLII